MKKSLLLLPVLVLSLLTAALLLPLPAELNHRGSAPSVRITDRNGILLQERPLGDEGRRAWVALDRIAPHLLNATIAVEDRRFFNHPGVDPIATARAAVQALKYRRLVSGGSTITQQLARRAYRLPRRWWAKPLEWLCALRLEVALSKREILEQYLNRVPYGNLTSGIEAASICYFAKPAAHLSLAESAFLAGLPQSPTRYNPFRHPELTRRRQEHVLKLMYRRALIDSTGYRLAMTTEVQIAAPAYDFNAPHFCDFIIEHFVRHGVGNGDGIKTTLDWQLQRSAEILVKGHVRQMATENVSNAAVLVLDNCSGEIVAMVGSADYFDEGHDGQVNGCTALRQPGSAIKPFTYGLALERGKTAADILPDIETHYASEGGDFHISNYDNTFHGPVRLRTALACSYNVPAVYLLEEMGDDLLLRRLHDAGFGSLKEPPVYYGLGLTLGNGEVTLLELTRAYRALANGGIYTPERYILNDYEPESGTQRIFSPHIAFILTDILADQEARAPAFGVSSPLNLPFDCAVKTGTSKDYRDNWAVGYTARYTVGVWVGNFDGGAMRRVSAVNGAGPLFRDIMLLLHRQEYPPRFSPPPGVVERTVCSRSGDLPNPYCPGTISEYFIEGREPTRLCDVHRIVGGEGTVLASEGIQRNGRELIAEVWPPLYNSWAAKRGNALYMPRVESGDDGSCRIAGEKDRLLITFPDDGDIYKIDPILRPEYQTLELEAVVPYGIDEISWWIDGSEFCRARRPFHARWRLVKGRHIFEVRGGGTAQGQVSAPVEILVM